VRAWLGTIARNVVRSDARSRTAREAREAAVEPPARVEDPAEAVARAELQQRLVECVLALEEPYRSTVILRFFEEQEVAAIGRLTKTNEDTVRTRIRRGVLKLREKLEAKAVEHARSDDESAAALALLDAGLQRLATAGGPGAGGAPHGPKTLARAPSSVRGPVAMVTRRALLGVAAATVVGSAWWWSQRTPSPEHRAATDTAAAARSNAPTAPPAELAATRATDTQPAPPQAPGPPPVAAAPAANGGTIRGVVTSPAGAQAAGARVWALRCADHVSQVKLTEFVPLVKDELRMEARGGTLAGWIGTKADADGRYEFAGLSTLAGWQIGAFEPSFGARVSEVRSFRRAQPELTVDARLVPGSHIRGTVADDAGRPIGNAVVRLVCKDVDGESDEIFIAEPRGDALGTFDCGFRSGDPIRIECHAPGFKTSIQADVEFETPMDEVVMDFEMHRRPGVIVRGRIVDPVGQPLDLLRLLEERRPDLSRENLPWHATLWAIPVADPGAPPLDGLSRPKGSCEGRIDYVANTYEVVVPERFRGVLELRVDRGLVGTATLDPGQPPDLPCDAAGIPKAGASTTLAIRFVDAETKLPIDLCRDAAPPQGNDGEHVSAKPTSNSDPAKGFVEYRCAPGFFKLDVAITGYEHALHFLDAPEEQSPEPLTLEVPRAAAAVHGTVLHADGSPDSRASVTIFRKDRDGMVDVSGAVVATNPDGEFGFESIAKGERFVVVSGSSGEAPAVVHLDVAPGLAPLEIRRVAAAPTRFRVVSAAAPKLARTILLILDANGLRVGGDESHATEKEPSRSDFAFPLAPGHYTAQIERDGFQPREIPLDVPVGDEIVLKLEAVEGATK
jgi:hypothetical protein